MPQWQRAHLWNPNKNLAHRPFWSVVQRTALIPSDLQPESIYVYTIIHGLAYCSVTIWSVHSSNKMWNLFEKCISERRVTWEQWSAHHHRAVLPHCTNQLHRDSKYKHSCLESAVYDLSLSLFQTFPYFLQIHLVSKLIFKYKQMRYGWSEILNFNFFQKF